MTEQQPLDGKTMLAYFVIYKPKQPTDTRDTLVAAMCLLFKEAWIYHTRPSQYRLWESKN